MIYHGQSVLSFRLIYFHIIYTYLSLSSHFPLPVAVVPASTTSLAASVSLNSITLNYSKPKVSHSTHRSMRKTLIHGPLTFIVNFIQQQHVKHMLMLPSPSHKENYKSMIKTIIRGEGEIGRY